VSDPQRAAADQGAALLDLYDRALPQVYGYLVARCGSGAVAEDLTAETFLAAVTAVKRGTVPLLTTAWLIGVARHKLVDHWRRQAREERVLGSPGAGAGDEAEAGAGGVAGAAGMAGAGAAQDPWDQRIDAVVAEAVLARLAPHHRTALVLRYLDGLSVPEVAEALGKGVHATEAVLVRAREAFRRVYREGRGE
jgi:RNA polymerase sigma-70 factor (ECF subfamily)